MTSGVTAASKVHPLRRSYSSLMHDFVRKSLRLHLCMYVSFQWLLPFRLSTKKKSASP